MISSAGQHFLIDAHNIIHLYDKAVSDISCISETYEGSLQIGFYGFSAYSFLPDLIKNFKVQHPHINVRLIDNTHSKLISYFKERRLDICILPDLRIDCLDNCNKEILFQDEYCMVVPTNHPLADREEVSIEEFKNDTFIALNQHTDSMDFLIPNGSVISNACVHYNFTPKTILGCSELYNMPMMVACHQGVTILAKHLENHFPDIVRFIKIRPCKYVFYTKGIWYPDNDNPCLAQFLDFLKSTIPSFGDK